MVTSDGKSLLVSSKDKYGIIKPEPKQKIEKPIPTDGLVMDLIPREEWRQIFMDTWRRHRDFFYDPNMHGVDWKSIGEHYEELIDDAVTRWDVNFVLGEMIGELNASHTYRRGGDTEDSETRNVGMLGIDWAVENSVYRIKRIVRGADWDSQVRSPLDEPGLQVQEGDYILAVNGVPVDTSRAPWAAFQGLGGKTVSLTVNSVPGLEGSREAFESLLEHDLLQEAWRRRTRPEQRAQGDNSK